MTWTRQALLLLRTLMVGACGALVFNAFGLPAAFMSGALVAVIMMPSAIWWNGAPVR